MISSIILSVEDWQIFVHKTFRQILPLSNLGKTKKSDRKLCRYFKFAHLIFPFTQIFYLVLLISFFSGLVLFFSFPIKTFCCFYPKHFTFTILIFFQNEPKEYFLFRGVYMVEQRSFLYQYLKSCTLILCSVKKI